MIRVTVTVRNPAQPEQTWDGRFLVDTNVMDCVVPGNQLRQMGLAPQGKRTYELADGTEMKMDVAAAKLEFMGNLVGTTLHFGPDNCEPVLGMLPLQSAGIEVDPRSQRLSRSPAVRLK